jgi:malate permease and related proteins
VKADIMTHYLSTMSTVVVPIIIVCVIGIVMQRIRPVETASLASISLFVLAPALVIVVLSDSHLNGQNVIQIALFTLLQGAMTWLVAKFTAKLFHMKGSSESALALTTMFSNSNNYGLPVLLLAYGHTGLVNGATYVIGQIIIVNTVGLYVASRSQVSPKDAFAQVMKAPLIYAVIVGVVLYFAHLHLPSSIGNGLSLLSNAYPGLVLLILGMQLGRIKSWIVRSKEVWIAVVLRVAIVPLLSEAAILILHIHGILAAILLVQSSMPAAVNAIILASKYGSDEEMVTLTVALTTIISFVTLPALIALA